MSKKNKSKFKISKAQILQATRQSQTSDDAPTVSSVNSIAGQVTSTVGSATTTAQLYGGQFEHVKTDMRFFVIIAVVYAVLLAAGYYFNNQTGFVLELGNRLYSFLGI